MRKISFLIVLILSCSMYCPAQQGEIVYAEMEFPLSFVGHVRQYSFNPLARFQTEVEGRIMELTSDPIVDIYQATAGRQAYRPCLGNFITLKLRDRVVTSFNLEKITWPDGRNLGFEDIWFSVEYRKLNPSSWGSNRNLVVTAKGELAFDAHYSDNTQKAPKPGEFYFPIVNKKAFKNNGSPAKAKVNKNKQKQIGYGRFTIKKIEENRSIHMQRRKKHPYYRKLKYPNGVAPVDSMRMFSFPNARITRNEQFLNARVHLISSATQTDVGYILNALGAENVKVSRYTDDSFSGFAFNCNHPYLQPPAVRRAFNYLVRKQLMLRRVLGGEGELISAPLPRRNFFYNLAVPRYEDSVKKALAILYLYRYWGMDVLEQRSEVKLFTSPLKGPAEILQKGDIVLEVDNYKIKSVEDLARRLKQVGDKATRVRVARDGRLVAKQIQKTTPPQLSIWSTAHVLNNKIEGFPELTLIANNPEGKNPLVKKICGALKEDLEKVGIKVNIDYLEGRRYYPRLQNADFDLAFRTLKLTGTPNLHRLFYYEKNSEKTSNSNYGRYRNSIINSIATSTKDVTEISILTPVWKKAHKILHDDPPYIMLWSRRHILIHTPKLVVVEPDSNYEVAHGYTKINGLINIFNEVHLWGVKEE